MRKLVFSFMRCNPPTKGHNEVIKQVMELAANNWAENLIVLSRSHDKKKNPIPPESKLHYMQYFWPDVNFELADPSLPSIVHYIRHLAHSYDGITVIAGKDRYDEYVNLFNNYNAREFYFRWWEVVEAGDSDTRDAISSTQMREWARHEQFVPFFFGSPKRSDYDTTEVIKMYNDVRKNLA